MKPAYPNPESSNTRRVISPESMPAPREEKSSGRKIGILAILAILCLCAAIYWLTREPEEKIALRQNAADLLNEKLSGTPLASMSSLVSPKNPLPPEVIAPPTDKGTLSGREITGVIAGPIPPGPEAGAAGYAIPVSSNGVSTSESERSLAQFLGLKQDTDETQVTFSQDFVPASKEDGNLKPGYLAALANWLVSRYRPASSGGSLAAGPQALNLECGSTLLSYAKGGRQGLLRYAFHPTMLSALYNLYIDRFLQDLNEAATQKGLTESQNRQFHQALAGQAALLAQTVKGVIQVSDLKRQIQHIDSLITNVVAANSDLTSALIELDRIRDGNGNQKDLGATQGKVERLSSLYRSAEAALGNAQSSLASSIRKHAGPGLDQETLLFIAAWVQRRKDAGGEATAAIQRSIELLQDLAARCARIGGGA